MPWKDKPTDNQIYYLARIYDAILYDNIGDIRDRLPDDLTKNAARLINTRKEISDEIKIAGSKLVVKNSAARSYINAELEKHGLSKLEVDS